jgi:hypothetical protein
MPDAGYRREVRCDLPNTAAAWNRAVRAAWAEGQGVWSLAIVTDFDRVLRRAAAGDPEAERIMHALPALLECLERHTKPSAAAPACLTCSGAFWREHCPGAVIILSAACDDPVHLLVSGVCRRCWTACGTDANRRAAVLDGLRQHYGLDDLRVLPPMAQAGNA